MKKELSLNGIKKMLFKQYFSRFDAQAIKALQKSFRDTTEDPSKNTETLLSVEVQRLSNDLVHQLTLQIGSEPDFSEPYLKKYVVKSIERLLTSFTIASLSTLPNFSRPVLSSTYSNLISSLQPLYLLKPESSFLVQKFRKHLIEGSSTIQSIVIQSLEKFKEPLQQLETLTQIVLLLELSKFERNEGKQSEIIRREILEKWATIKFKDGSDFALDDHIN